MNTDLLERKILLHSVRNSIIIVLIYLMYDLLTGGNTDLIVGSVFVCLVFTACYWLITTHFSVFVKRLLAFIYLICVATGFFSLGGMSALTAIDFCGLMLVFSTIFGGRERGIFIRIVLILILFLCYVEVFQVSLIDNLRANDHPIVNVIEVIVRLLSLLQIFLTYKGQYDQEQSRLFWANEKLEKAHRQIATYNKNLQKLVDSRTQTIQSLNKKLIEYTYFNSHKTRAPLARIQGLLHLLKLNSIYKEDEDIRRVIDLTYNNSLELDNIIRQFSALLEVEISKSQDKDETKQRSFPADEHNTIMYKKIL
ncbi:hypothetical protein LVD17_09600 [Fulvivirga ulvae]|uniref:hypothetical protein n=1 Tax=Fulvivirga ulvae TaxID=2904245 RepID=UPI001F368E20|nr:hypothetical protein [Fulvivirga ulvae]UII34067.1 hypothetical protein LVD17_09600 [Fulvivirga ulvae]